MTEDQELPKAVLEFMKDNQKLANEFLKVLGQRIAIVTGKDFVLHLKIDIDLGDGEPTPMMETEAHCVMAKVSTNPNLN